MLTLFFIMECSWYHEAHSVRENYLNLRWDLLVSLLLAILFLPNGCEKLLDVVPSANYLCTYLTERINYRITNTAYRPLWTNLNSLNNKFWIVTTKRVIVITYRLGEWVFHIRWHQYHKHKTYSDLLSQIDAKKSYFAWISNIPSRAFLLEIMSSLDKLMSSQNKRWAPYLAHSLILRSWNKPRRYTATPRNPQGDLRQELDCKIALAANEKLKAIHAYVIQNYFLTCEDYYHEATDYMVEVLYSRSQRTPSRCTRCKWS